jgi:hypothetical protein
MSVPVYGDPIAQEEVSCSHGGSEITYNVWYGPVNWSRQPGHDRLAVVVRMRYDGEISNQMPPHILEEDVDAVLAAINRLRGRR